MYVVRRAFTTPTQRFAVGDKVSGDDLAGPVPVGRWLEQKFIEAEKMQKTGKQATPDPAAVPADTPATAA